MMPAAALRYVRIRSWKEFVLVIVMALLATGIQFALQKYLNMEERKARIISYVGIFGLTLIILFAGCTDI